MLATQAVPERHPDVSFTAACGSGAKKMDGAERRLDPPSLTDCFNGVHPTSLLPRPRPLAHRERFAFQRSVG